MLKNATFGMLIFLCQTLQAQSLPELSKASQENFKLIDNFEVDKPNFKRDSFDLPDISVDGGRVVAYHAGNRKYKVFELSLSGETEKIRYTFYTDKKSILKITKQTKYQYDKPRAIDNKIKETTTYYSYEKNAFKVYNAERKPIKDLEDDKKNKISELFERVLNKK